MVSESRSPPLCSRSISEFDRTLKSRATASVRRPSVIGDGFALGADRLDDLRAARVDSADDLVRIGVDGAARRRRGLGKPIGDRVAVEPDRLDGLFAACADAGDDLVRVLGRGAARRLEVSASRSATESPWKRIASTACSPLALMRATTSSAYAPTALRARLGGPCESIGDRVAMEADRFDGLFAACADAGDDVVRVLADGAARGLGGLGESVGDRVAMGADRRDGLCSACADAG